MRVTVINLRVRYALPYKSYIFAYAIIYPECIENALFPTGFYKILPPTVNVIEGVSMGKLRFAR